MSHSKRRAERDHAKRRARQRYKLIVNRLDLEALVNDIQSNKGEFIYKSSNRATVWKLECKGKSVLVVYDKLRAQIVTFLPLDSLEKLKKKQERRLKGECVL